MGVTAECATHRPRPTVGLTFTAMRRTDKGDLLVEWVTNGSMPPRPTIVLYAIDAFDEGDVYLRLGVKLLDEVQIALFVFDVTSSVPTNLRRRRRAERQSPGAVFPQDAIADVMGDFDGALHSMFAARMSRSVCRVVALIRWAQHSRFPSSGGSSSRDRWSPRVSRDTLNRYGDRGEQQVRRIQTMANPRDWPCVVELCSPRLFASRACGSASVCSVRLRPGFWPAGPVHRVYSSAAPDQSNEEEARRPPLVARPLEPGSGGDGHRNRSEQDGGLEIAGSAVYLPASPVT